VRKSPPEALKTEKRMNLYSFVFIFSFSIQLVSSTNAPAWGMFRNGLDKSGKSFNVSVLPTVETGNISLSFYAPANNRGSTSSPVIGTADDGTDLVLVMDNCGTVIMYGTSTTSEILWTYDTGDGCDQNFSPSFTPDGSMVIAVTTTAVYSFETLTGKLLWFYEDPTGILFNGSPLILEKYETAFVSIIDDSADGSCYVFGFDLGTGDVKTSYCFSDPTCPPTELTFTYGYADYVFFTGCTLDGGEPVIYRGHLAESGADCFKGFGFDHNAPVIFVPDTSGDGIHSVVLQLSNGVLGGLLTITGDQSHLCSCETEYFQTMALVSLQPNTRPDINPPMIVTFDVIHNIAIFITPTPNPESTPLPGVPPCLFNYSVNLNTLAPLSPRVMPTVDASGNVLFADNGGNIYVIKSPLYSTASLLYSTNSTEPIFSNVVIGGKDKKKGVGNIYFTDYDGSIYGLGFTRS
jgi:hypothetical protein